jgi:hypothetical protein
MSLLAKPEIVVTTPPDFSLSFALLGRIETTGFSSVTCD